MRRALRGRLVNATLPCLDIDPNLPTFGRGMGQGDGTRHLADRGSH